MIISKYKTIKIKEKVDQIPSLNVLNGIAYHPQRKNFFVTGKNWSKLFEVRLQPKEYSV